MTKEELKEWIAELREMLRSQKETANKMRGQRDALKQWGGFQSIPGFDAVIDSFESNERDIQRAIEYLDELIQSLQE